jgi:hypothetical protein
MSTLQLTPTSGVNLVLEGSVGFFQVAQQDGSSKTLEVAFLETHVGFDNTYAANEEMLKQLTPFRELFDYSHLDFDEIMQRDIDDARVSTELIPYLLDATTASAVRFFPPIVAVVLPIAENDRRPGRLYPKVTRETGVTLNNGGQPHNGNRIRSGSIGSEAFEFEYPVVDGRSRLHDLARLKLNTNRVRLVIIDGQHRAMALLALYRNFRDDWSDARRLPFKDYYAEWTRSVIGNPQRLQRVHLPVIVCAFPDLCEGYEGSADVVRAARSTFLTLNKTARKVSASRNILLDDRDLIAHFLRSTLSRIKARDHNSSQWLRICNVELDQYRDRVKIESPVACTGVAHIYYMIEHMMFSHEEDLDGVKPRSGKFGKRGQLESNLSRRLDAVEMLGQEVASKLKRTSYTTDVADRLCTRFHERYGQFVLQIFDEFLPLQYHSGATRELAKELEAESVPQVRSIMFEGQNIGRSFDEYFAHVKQRCAEYRDAGHPVPPDIDLAHKHLKATSERVAKARHSLRRKRAELLAERVSDRPKLKLSNGAYQPLFYAAVDRFYDNIYCTVAFQAALACGFFSIIESAEEEADRQGRKIDRQTELKAYVSALNEYFAPTSSAKLKTLIRAFHFALEDDSGDDWKEVGTNAKFSNVVTQQEMKPDEWTKYRYVLLEIWSSDNPDVESAKSHCRDHCRRQVFTRLYDLHESQYCEREKVVRMSLDASQRKAVFDSAYSAFDDFLKSLGVSKREKRVDHATAKAWLDQAAMSSADEADAMNA